MNKKSLVIALVIAVSVAGTFAVVYGWTNPAASPPAGNPPPPVQLQGASPGTVQTGNINISGTGLFGGNVGIGTTVPGARLDVVGEIRATHYPWVATNYVGTYHTIHLPTAGQFWVRVVGGARQSANVWISRTVHENFSWAGELAARVTGTGGGWGSFGGQIVLTVNKSGEAGSAQLLHRVAHAEHIGGATAADGLYVLLEGGGRTYHFRGATEATNVGVDGTFDKGGSWREFAVGPGGVHAVFANNAHILAGGNVGIGTTTPGARLQVQGVGTTTAATVNITDSTGASRFFVRDDGNVGIGTTAPTARLHVAGHFQITGGDFIMQGPDQWGPGFGGSGGWAFAWACPAGFVVVGIHGRSQSWVDQIGVICRKL